MRNYRARRRTVKNLHESVLASISRGEWTHSGGATWRHTKSNLAICDNGWPPRARYQMYEPSLYDDRTFDKFSPRQARQISKALSRFEINPAHQAAEMARQAVEDLGGPTPIPDVPIPKNLIPKLKKLAKDLEKENQ